MKEARVGRRKFISALAGSAAVISALPRKAFGLLTTGPRSHPLNSTETRSANSEETVKSSSRLKFAVIGVNHDHIHGQIEAVVHGGGEFISFYAKEPDLAAAFSKRYPQAKLALNENEILEDAAIQLVVSAGIPNERAPLGVRVMQHGKDYMSDKPGITTLEQLAEVRRVQAQTAPHLFNHVQRAARQSGDGEGGRVG